MIVFDLSIRFRKHQLSEPRRLVAQAIRRTIVQHRVCQARHEMLKLFSKVLKFIGKRWCCQTGLNCRPLHYQWSALPLSYGSMPGIGGIGPNGRPLGGRFLPQGPIWRKRAGRP